MQRATSAYNGRVERYRAGGVCTHVRASLLLRHRHAQHNALLLTHRHVAVIVGGVYSLVVPEKKIEYVDRI